MCDIKRPNVKIIGIGGAGCIIIKTLLKDSTGDADYFVAASDEETLERSNCENKIKVAVPREEFMKTALDSFKAVLTGADMLIIISGLGGDIGSTLVPILVEIASGMGITAIPVVCTPFEFEGKTRMAKSVECLGKLKKLSCSVIVVPNHRITKIVPKTISIKTAFEILNLIVAKIVNAIIAPIFESGIINVAFQDVAAVFKNGGLAYFGIGIGEGENCIREAIKNAIHNPISPTKIDEITRVLLSVTGGNDMELQDVTVVADAVRGAVGSNANVVLSVQQEKRWNKKMRVAIIGNDDKKSCDVLQVKVQNFNSDDRFNDEVKTVLSKAKELAEQYKTYYIASEHLVYAMLLTDCKAGEILKSCGCSKEIYKRYFVNALAFDAAVKGYTPKTKMILQHAEEDVILKKGYEAEVGTEHVLYEALSAHGLASNILNAMDMNMKKLVYLLEEAINS